jgi:prepilin-type N-terminal cleavage/methylation domain-containing protein
MATSDVGTHRNPSVFAPSTMARPRVWQLLLLMEKVCRNGTGEMMIRKAVNAQGGFTLVESVMAVVILGIALGACILSFSMAMRTVNTAANQMAAVHACRTELETLRTYTLTNAATLTSGSHSFTNNLIGTYVVSNVNTWTRIITVSVPYTNHIHTGSVSGKFSTNTLATTLVSTLHP